MPILNHLCVPEPTRYTKPEPMIELILKILARGPSPWFTFSETLNTRHTGLCRSLAAFLKSVSCSGAHTSSTANFGRQRLSTRNARSSWFPYMIARVVTKAAYTSETPQPTRAPLTGKSPQIGFLKGIRTQPRSRTVACEFLTVFFRT